MTPGARIATRRRIGLETVLSASNDSQFAPGPDLAPVLLGLLRREGIGLLEQRRRLNGLLRDYAPMAIRDIRLLLAAYDAGTPGRLGASRDPSAAGSLAAEADRMVEEFGCARPLALNAVQTWGRALADLRAPEPRPPSPTPVLATPVHATASTPDEERPGWFGRWGGIGIGLLLVLIALVRWLSS